MTRPSSPANNKAAASVDALTTTHTFCISSQPTLADSGSDSKPKPSARKIYFDTSHDNSYVVTLPNGEQFLCPSARSANETLAARDSKGSIDPAGLFKIPAELLGQYRWRPNTKFGTHWQEWKFPIEASEASWVIDADDFLLKELPPRMPIVSQATVKLNGHECGYAPPVFLSESLNQIFAQRGVGKSMFVLGLLNLVIDGGTFLNYSSDGGHKVLLVDAELPGRDLQERLQKLVGKSSGHLKMMRRAMLPENKFPSLSQPQNQEKFLRIVERFSPDVIIIDSLTAAFRFDTNEGGESGWLQVNDFLLRLRMMGCCVILIHHAGKSGEQRGRSDGDDHLDVSLKLEGARGWEPGQNLHATVTYSKVRQGGNLQGFDCKLVDGEWQLAEDDLTTDIFNMLVNRKGVRAIMRELDIKNQRQVYAVKARFAERIAEAQKQHADLKSGVEAVFGEDCIHADTPTDTGKVYPKRKKSQKAVDTLKSQKTGGIA
jgi:hypothetical protein